MQNRKDIFCYSSKDIFWDQHIFVIQSQVLATISTTISKWICHLQDSTLRKTPSHLTVDIRYLIVTMREVSALVRARVPHNNVSLFEDHRPLPLVREIRYVVNSYLAADNPSLCNGATDMNSTLMPCRALSGVAFLHLTAGNSIPSPLLSQPCCTELVCCELSLARSSSSSSSTGQFSL